MTIGDLVDASRGPRIGTIGDLCKNIDGVPLIDGDSREKTETELKLLVERCVASAKDCLKQIAELNSRILENMTPQGRAAHQVMFGDLHKRLHDIEELSLKAQKALIAKRRSARERMIAKLDVAALEADVAILRSHSDAVLSARVALDLGNRRKLASALSRAEIELAEAMR